MYDDLKLLFPQRRPRLGNVSARIPDSCMCICVGSGAGIGGNHQHRPEEPPLGHALHRHCGARVPGGRGSAPV